MFFVHTVIKLFSYFSMQKAQGIVSLAAQYTGWVCISCWNSVTNCVATFVLDTSVLEKNKHFLGILEKQILSKKINVHIFYFRSHFPFLYCTYNLPVSVKYKPWIMLCFLIKLLVSNTFILFSHQNQILLVFGTSQSNLSLVETVKKSY